MCYTAYMRQQKAKRVVIALRLSTQAGQRTLRGILRFISTKRLHWDIRLKRDSDEFCPVNVARYPQWKIDGIIFGMNPPDDRLDESIRTIAGQKPPIVAVDVRDQPALEHRKTGIAFVNTDTTSVGRSAAEFLIAHGTYRSYGYVADFRNRSWSVLRGQEFAKAIEKRGLTCTTYQLPSLARDDFTELCAWLNDLQKPAALFVAFDDRALTVLEACRRKGIKVPEEVAVLGVDDDELIDGYTHPSLSSVHPDHERQGFIAAERLHALMSGKTAVQRRTFVPILKISQRGSTSATANAGALVQTAIAFINSNYQKGIDPGAVATELGISRRLLDLRFREITGKTVTETIRGNQLDEVRRRLIHSSDTIDKIATDCGFPNPTYLKELFKKRFTMTMRDFRKANTFT